MPKFIQWVQDKEWEAEPYLQIGKLSITFKEEYSQFWKDCNWLTYHLWQCELERDDLMSCRKLDVILFGLGFWLRVPFRTPTQQTQEIRKTANEVYESIPWEDAKEQLDNRFP